MPNGSPQLDAYNPLRQHALLQFNRICRIMSSLLSTYRTVHQQGFLPIFTATPFNSKRLVEACVQAGCKAIEYTLRSPDAREMIPWIRKTYPDLLLLVGSTMDSEKLVHKMQRKHPQLITIDAVADLDVHGFVSMLGWSAETIARWAPTHLVAPTAMTISEALVQTDAGAHFQKMLGNDLGFVKRCRGAAAFDFCPVFVTGGMTLEKMGSAYDAGAVMTASGFDLTLSGAPDDVDVAAAAEVTRNYVNAGSAHQRRAFPQIADRQASDAAWLDSLPHWHPF